MSRCRACDSLFSEIELRLKKEDGSPEDLCVACKVYIRESIDSDDIHIGHIPWYSVEDTYFDDSDWSWDDE